MQPSSQCCEPSYQPLGERRRKPDLASFSLDLSWARAVSDSARSRAYPSPPMSGSPPLPSRHNPEYEDRGQGGLSAPPHNVSRGWQISQTELRENVRGPVIAPPYQHDLQPPSYPSYSRAGNAQSEQTQYQYQQQQHAAPPPQPPQQMAPLSIYGNRHPQPPAHYPDLERYAFVEERGYNSPKAQRKTKGHVASACVPCKRAHLRCDSQRPCGRCSSNGKEDACIDVQHKKRGRPRLRDEREQRLEGLGQPFAPHTEHILRRPMSLYSSHDSPMHHSEGVNRSGPYRVLKSQSGHHPVISRYLEHASPADASIYTTPTPRVGGVQDSPCAYLSMDLQISFASRSFCDLIGIPSISGRKLLDIVAAGDRDKVYRLQRTFEEERHEREPNYLPPIFGKVEEDRVIQSIGLGAEDTSQFRTERQETFTFQESSGQQRTHQVRLGLAKKDSTYFVVLVLVIAATPQEMYQMSSSPYPREAGYGFRTPQQSFAPPPIASYPQYPTPYSEPRSHDPPVNFRQPPPLPSNSGTASVPTPTPSYAQPFTRLEYSQAQNPRQIPRSELPQGQGQHQNEFRLPPLQVQPAGQPMVTRGDDRGSRLDIGGLLEGPDALRRRS